MGSLIVAAFMAMFVLFGAAMLLIFGVDLTAHGIKVTTAVFAILAGIGQYFVGWDGER
jgi:hypothetical protein